MFAEYLTKKDDRSIINKSAPNAKGQIAREARLWRRFIMRPAKKQEGVYTIGVATKLLGVHHRTLRIYEEEGLILPQRDPKNNRRLYSDQDLVWIRCIRQLIHQGGLTVKAIRRLLDLVPCWEIKHCPEEQWRRCLPNLNIPHMKLPPQVAPPELLLEGKKARAEKTVEIKLFYGVREFGAILPCSKCIKAERVLRKVAQRFGDRITIVKYEASSPEADRYEVLLTPTIFLDEEPLVIGGVPSEPALERAIEKSLASRRESGE